MVEKRQVPPRRARKQYSLLLFSVILIGASVFALTYNPPGRTPEEVPQAATAPTPGSPGGERTAPLRIWGQLEHLKANEAQLPAFVATPYPAPTIDEPVMDPTRPRPRAMPPAPTPDTREASPARRSAPAIASITRAKATVSGAARQGVMARFEAEPEGDEEDAPRSGEQLPTAPSPLAISKVMSSIRDQVQRCYDTTMVPGEVVLTLTVAGKTGKVRRAAVSERSSTARCIRALTEELRFGRFARQEISIRYPFSFR